MKPQRSPKQASGQTGTEAGAGTHIQAPLEQLYVESWDKINVKKDIKLKHGMPLKLLQFIIYMCLIVTYSYSKMQF